MIDYGEHEERQKNNPTAPSHYKHGDTYEVIKVLEAWELDECFYLGNVVKYVARAGKKDHAKEIEDLEKAKSYIEMKIKKLKNNNYEISNRNME